jgi:hypothetical protein
MTTKPEMIFMSKKLGVSVPFTPVHTPEEHELFRRCMSENLTLEQTLDKFAVCLVGTTQPQTTKAMQGNEKFAFN